ncbi:EthD family reductase [Haloglomus litoreum]|uniref:EthD family reductase n=1 Tax=Haloglomus litoreum TaxID=3034026 RepID=UPI0023E84B9C|nr:EthD family reductase [Haloglomus sp. DT116]
MHKLIAVWSAPDPEDEEAFEEHYQNVHAPKAAAVPNLQKLVTTRTSEGLEDADPAFYRVAEMVFETPEAMHEAEESEEWQAVREDAGEMIERFGVTMEVGIGERTVHEGDN